MYLELSEGKSWEIELRTKLNLTKVQGHLWCQNGLHCSPSSPKAVCNLFDYL